MRQTIILHWKGERLSTTREWDKPVPPEVVEPVLGVRARPVNVEEYPLADALKLLGLIDSEGRVTPKGKGFAASMDRDSYVRVVEKETENYCYGLGTFWETGDSGELHKTIDKAVEAFWESCEGYSENILKVSEYVVDEYGKTTPTGRVEEVDFTAWLQGRGVTDEPEVKAP